MDELEKKEGLPETENTGAEDVSEADTEKKEQSAEELIEELEEIKDMFQRELDKAAEEDSAGEILIQELEDFQEEAELFETEFDESDLCQCCGEQRRDVSLGDDYPYCNDCRNLMKATPFRFVGVVFLILTMLVSGLALGRAMNNAVEYEAILDADSAYSSGYVVDAIYSYQAYLSTKSADDVSMKVVKNVSKAFAELGYYSNASAYIDQFFSQAQLKMPWNKKYADIKSEYEILDKTTALINTEFSAALNNGEFDYEEDIAKADKLIAENKESGEYSESFLEYAKFLLMMVDGQPNKTQLEQLKKVEAADSEGKYKWLYTNYLVKAYAREGDEENAKAYYEKALDFNRQEMTAYRNFADVYRFSKSVSAEKILEIAEAAQKVCSQSSYPEYHRIFAVGYALKGDYESALNSMASYLQTCQATVSDYNFYAVCALAGEDKETYKEAKETLKSYGYEFGSVVNQFKKGKITMEEILTDKEGEI